MKSKIVILFLLLSPFINLAQEKKVASPAETSSGKIGGATITINYGSPSVRDRKIWGELVPYDKVWRAGANDATTFETSQKITVEGKDLPAGKYTLFVIPEKEGATVIFNKVEKQWGAYEYDEKKDILRVKVKTMTEKAKIEKLVYTIDAKGFKLSWDTLTIPVAIK